MLNFIDHKIMRGGQKVGWVDNDHVFDEHGVKLGYFDHNGIYDHGARKIARIEGNHIFTLDGNRRRLDDSHNHVSGGSISDLERAAIWLLIGD